MKRMLLCFLALAFLALQGGAQEVSIGAAQALSQRLVQAEELAFNARIRFSVLAQRMKDLKKKKTTDNILRFFRDTRALVRAQTLRSSTEQDFGELERQMRGLALKQDRTLELEAVTANEGLDNELLSSDGFSLEAIRSTIFSAEQAATEQLKNSNSATLLFLRDDLLRMGRELEQGFASSDRVSSVIGSRARVLTSENVSRYGPGFIEHLNRLGEVLHGTFQPEVLRETRGQLLELE